MKTKERNKNFTLMSMDELKDALVGLKRELFALRIRKANQQVVDTSRIHVLKKDVARVMTAITGRRMSEGRG